MIIPAQGAPAKWGYAPMEDTDIPPMREDVTFKKIERRLERAEKLLRLHVYNAVFSALVGNGATSEEIRNRAAELVEEMLREPKGDIPE